MQCGSRVRSLVRIVLVVASVLRSLSEEPPSEEEKGHQHHLQTKSLPPSTFPSKSPSPSTASPISESQQTPLPSKSPSEVSSTPRKVRKPHTIMVVIDDLGYDDPGFKGSGINTPTIDKLVASGTLLTNYYTLTYCTPTRIAIMTGRYPYRSGIYQTARPVVTWGLDVADRTVANELRERGYQAHAIGKWHMGHAWYDYLPTYRGFQSFFGFWSNQDYYNHTNGWYDGVYDMRWDPHEFCDLKCSRNPDVRGVYSTTVLTDQTVKRIRALNVSKGPLFMYLAYQGIHKPLEVPEMYKRPYRGRPNWTEDRITYAGMLSAVDKGIATIVNTLKQENMWKDTLLIITSDNGSPKIDDAMVHSLHGYKGEMFEGGIRADGIVSGPARKWLQIAPGKNPSLFHVTDWLPTLAGISDSDDGHPTANWTRLDGVNQRRALRRGVSQRHELYVGLAGTPWDRKSAIRRGDMKLIELNLGEQYMLYNLTADKKEETNLIGKKRYETLTREMKRGIRKIQSQFMQNPKEIGRCPKIFFGETTWRQESYIPWCEAKKQRTL